MTQDPGIDPRSGFPIPPDYVVDQNTGAYTDEDHAVWRFLFRRQAQLLRGRVVDDFHLGLARLRIDEDRIPDFEVLNAQLRPLTGWNIVPVPGLVPDRVFFSHLAARRFPSGYWVRPRATIDYIEQPDVFHDVFGHVPLLTHRRYADYMQAYGEAGLALSDPADLARLARLYWYTIEFGLMAGQKGLRIFGAGIASSAGEVIHALESPAPLRLAFDVRRVLRTRYRIDAFQRTYFVLPDFASLPHLDAASLKGWLDETRQQDDLAPDQHAPLDIAFHAPRSRRHRVITFAGS